MQKKLCKLISNKIVLKNFISEYGIKWQIKRKQLNYKEKMIVEKRVENVNNFL